MIKYNYKNFFIIYLIVLYTLICFYLYEKQGNEVEWTISEWLINYQGGLQEVSLVK